VLLRAWSLCALAEDDDGIDQPLRCASCSSCAFARWWSSIIIEAALRVSARFALCIASCAFCTSSCPACIALRRNSASVPRSVLLPLALVMPVVESLPVEPDVAVPAVEESVVPDVAVPEEVPLVPDVPVP
jgi:hypothetical protein